MKKRYQAVWVVFSLAGFMFSPPVTPPVAVAGGMTAQAAAARRLHSEKHSGKIIGVSKKARTIALSVGKGAGAHTVMIHFDAETQGMEHAGKGEKVVVYVDEGPRGLHALEIKPKLAKLPPGVSEMSPDELAGLVARGPEKGGYFLVDARPAGRYAGGHVPTAVSIPVKKLESQGAALLPKDKDFPLIFYCGGPT